MSLFSPSEFEKKKTIFDQENIILKEDKKRRRKLKVKEAEKVAEFEKFLRNTISFFLLINDLCFIYIFRYSYYQEEPDTSSYT